MTKGERERIERCREIDREIGEVNEQITSHENALRLLRQRLGSLGKEKNAVWEGFGNAVPQSRK